MIGGMTEHDGGQGLAVHLAKLEDNESIVMRTHGLSADTIDDAITELRLMSLGSRCRTPLIHAWASPSTTYSGADWEYHRAVYEQEFGLEGHPCVEVFHIKLGQGGRVARHVHRVYLRLDAEGRAVRTSYSAIRQEKVSRISELMAGERLTSGCFNKGVIAKLRLEGRQDVADAMIRAGLGDVAATSAPRPSERAMAERLADLAPDEVWRRARDAWRRSDDGASFRIALVEAGLHLAHGAKCPVVVTPSGGSYPLLRAINKGGERQDGAAIRKADLDARLRGVILPPASQLDHVASFDPGVFAIINLDRLSTPAQVPALHPDSSNAGSVPPPAPNRLTQEQEAALYDLEEAFHRTAAAQAKAIREAIEIQVTQDIARRREAEVLRRRIADETVSWQQPSIGIVGWRDAYRAQLAGLPDDYGALLRWVEKLDAERRKVVLRSGVTITLAPTQARATRGTADTIAVMIAHAKARGWKQVNISGGTAEWRIEMAKAAARADLMVADAELQDAVVTERAQMHAQALLAQWRSIGAALTAAQLDQQRSLTGAVLQILAEIAKQPDIVELAIDEKERQVLVNDLGAYRRYLGRLQELRSGAGPPHLG